MDQEVNYVFERNIESPLCLFKKKELPVTVGKGIGSLPNRLKGKSTKTRCMKRNMKFLMSR